MLSDRRRLVIAGVGVLVLALLVVVGVRVVGDLRRTQLRRVLDTVPAASLRVTYTDWAAIRTKLKPKRVDTATGLHDFMNAAFDRDLSSGTSLDSSAVALQRKYGFSPANASWEVYAVARKGAAMVLKLDDDVDLDKIADTLERLGYRRPADDDGVWAGSPDLVAGIDPSITPELQNIVVDRDRHLIVSSDTASYAAATEKVVRGDAASLADTDLAALVGKVRDPASAYLWRGGFACQDLSMAKADGTDRAQGARLVTAAGGVDSLDGLVETLGTDDRLQVAMGFENDDQAKANLRPRAKLFVGPAAGRTDSFATDITLTRSRTDGSAVLFDLHAKDSADAPITLISQGPVLFLTC